jgi:hypothetical protein
MTSSQRCPRCGSTFVHGARFTLYGGKLHERACWVCGLMEDRRSDDDDLGEWLASWWRARSAPDPLPTIEVPAVYRTLLEGTTAYGDTRFQLYRPAAHPDTPCTPPARSAGSCRRRSSASTTSRSG